jgi:hypothetical protein
VTRRGNEKPRIPKSVSAPVAYHHLAVVSEVDIGFLRYLTSGPIWSRGPLITQIGAETRSAAGIILSDAQLASFLQVDERVASGRSKIFHHRPILTNAVAVLHDVRIPRFLESTILRSIDAARGGPGYDINMGIPSCPS